MTAPAIVRGLGHGQPGAGGRPADKGTGHSERQVGGSGPAESRRRQGGVAVEHRRGEAHAHMAARDGLAVLRRAAPLAAVWLTAVVAHAGLAPHLAVRGVEPDVLLVVVVAVAAGRGARVGAGVGFAAGLGADLFLATPLGTSALAYTLVGHIVGRSSRPRPANSAAALCSPTSTCFACRAGRRHDAAAGDSPSSRGKASRSARRQRQATARRAALRRSAMLTFLAVAAGRVGTAAVATALAGIPFPTSAGVAHIIGVAVVSAPLGVPAIAAGRYAGRGRGGHR